MDEFHYMGVAEENIHLLDPCFFAKSRVVYLVNDQDVQKSLHKAIVSHPQKILVHIDSMKIRSVVEDVWSFCLPGIPFPVRRYEEIKYKRIDIEDKEDYTQDYTEQLKTLVSRLVD